MQRCIWITQAKITRPTCCADKRASIALSTQKAPDMCDGSLADFRRRLECMISPSSATLHLLLSYACSLQSPILSEGLFIHLELQVINTREVIMRKQ